VDALDGIIVVLLVIAAFHGARRGAAVQLATFAGFLAGLAVGVALVLAVAPRVNGTTAKTVVAVALLLVPSALAARLGRGLGEHAGFRQRRARARALDSAAGSLLAVGGTLVVCWLFASVLVDSSTNLVSSQIERSAIVHAIARAMPPVPDEFAAVERYLSNSGFPVVLVNALPQPVGPVVLPTQAQVVSDEQRVDASTVKVESFGCGDNELEGSAFVVGPDLLATNAHVVAGADHIEVVLHGRTLVAAPVLFDPVLDLAVLRTAPLDRPVLRVDADVVERGIPAVLFGYPDNGPLTVGKAGIEARYVAEGRDIYSTALTTRTVYTLEAVVRPGNSGGPLVSTSGEVIGVVFSRSASNPDVGYALASPAVLREIDEVSASTPEVSTESCVSGD
jgi:S1-C subfamily serine protease